MKAKAGTFYYSFLLLWPFLLIVGFASQFLPTLRIPGYRWTVELAVAAFLLVTILAGVLSRSKLSSILGSETRLLTLPLVYLVTWSFASVLWAHSWRSALTHSLLWACYLIFLLVARDLFNDADRRTKTLQLLFVVTAIISLACLVEFFGSAKPLSAAFYERYFVNSEILVTLLPIILAFSFLRNSYYGMVVSVFTWSAVVATHSRATFIAGMISLFVFFALGFLRHRILFESKRAVATILVLIGATLAFQFVFTGGQPTTFMRLAVQDEITADSTKLRLVFWSMAWEGFKWRPITGLGGNNFFTDYKILRERYSSSNPTDAKLEITEETIPERAHNEYLQILAELGLVGALLFAWLLVGITYMFVLAIRNRASILTIGALSGMLAFLVASVASSYSFRFPANGICFFFLLGLASRELLARDDLVKGERHDRFLRLIPVMGTIMSAAMIAFCLVRATSIWHMTNSLNAKDESVRTEEIENAIAIDPSEPMFRFHYGQQLYLRGKDDDAISQYRIAIDNGLATSTAFFSLAKIQERSGQSVDALSTFEESLRVFPRSVFLKTAFGSFLKKNGEDARSEAEYEGALLINEKQARSWQLAHDEGLERLAQTSRLDDRYVSTFDLKPESAPLVVSNFQRRAANHLP